MKSSSNLSPQNKADDVVHSQTNQDDVWLIGDKYFETAKFEGPQDGQTPSIASRPFAGGVWYVKQFFDNVGLAQDVRLITYPIPTKPTQNLFAASHIFRPFPRQSTRPSDKVLRIAKGDQVHLASMEIQPLSSETLPKLLVIEDMNLRYRVDGKNEWQPLLKRFSEMHLGSYPRIVVLLGGELPDLSTDAEFKAEPDDDLWSNLARNHRKDTVVIVNADLLRFKGANISRRVSWERTAQDLVTEIQCHPRLEMLSQFAHLIIRFGVTAAIHCFKSGRDTHRVLYYDPTAFHGIFRGIGTEGAIIGNNSVFAASVAKELLVGDSSKTAFERMGLAIEKAIPACQRLFRFGYPIPRENDDERWLAGWPSPFVFDEAPNKGAVDELKVDDPTFSEFIRRAEIPPAVESWSIINQSAPGSSMMKLAQQVVFRGIRKSLNLSLALADSARTDARSRLLASLSQYHAPLAHFGELTAIDRDEIENFRGVYNLIRLYHESKEDKPLSVAVFGPPGAGKTYAVSEIARAIDMRAQTQATVTDANSQGTLDNAIITVNLAQLSSFEELCGYLRSRLNPKRVVHVTEEQVGSLAATIAATIPTLKDTPLIFFDEFDCQFNGEPLGWLKYFLGPMEEGIIGPTHDDQWLLMHKSIFVFAGGTKHTYRDFSGEDPSLSEQERLKFEMVKGPDFTSRLRGHVDIKGVNRVGLTDKTFLLRRALMLRQYLKTRNLLKKNEYDEYEAQIDYSVIHALLRISNYKHGARSMKALVAMCCPLWGRIEKSSLPSPKLLDMHVDGVEFHALLEDYRPTADDPKPKPEMYHLS
ncbi:MAG TPA: hypothetical protein VEX43_01860 [Chthoniobacterales bacterium]|nr:hypothetical protein [Chthoniobacterales bacterium]